MKPKPPTPIGRPAAPRPSTAVPIGYCGYASPLGAMVLAAQGPALWGVWFSGQQHMPAMQDWQATSTPVLQEAVAQLSAYFAGQRQHFDLPLARDRGTAFQAQVWARLQHIGYGQSCSYADIAKDIGKPHAVRAVGAAIGRNPWSIVVPCHRVLGRNGTLTGYAGGLERKRALLQLENPA